MSEFMTKTQNKFTYHGAGYEVALRHVPMIKIGGEWVINVNLSVIDRLVFAHLPHHASRLTGSQVRFIRDYTNMTLKAFADRFGVTHAAVKKWENAGDAPTNMSWSTEKDIRLFVLMHANPAAGEFQQCYVDLAVAPPAGLAPILIDLESMAVA